MKKGIDFVQREKNANPQFRFRTSETCGGDIEQRESLFFVPAFLL